MADDFGQRERLQHLLGEGLHGVDEHLIWAAERGTGRTERGPGLGAPLCLPSPNLLRGSGRSWDPSTGSGAGRRGVGAAARGS